MKKNNYNNKKIRKALKQKKSPSKKLPMLLQRDKSPVHKRRDKPKLHDKLKNINKKQPNWKMPSIIFVSILITIILIIPTLVVLPYINKGENQMTVTNKQEEPEKVEISFGDSPFSVAVMRASSDQVENVPLETYVSRVVASEMPVGFELEALKAQSLAARTLIVNRMLQQDGSDKYTVTDTVNDQVYSNEMELRNEWGNEFNENMNKIKKAVAATEGEILTYNDAPIFPAFFSTSNGYTENSEDYWENKMPYLRSVKSPWDEKSPEFLEQKILSIGEVENALAVDLPNQISVNMSRTESNRVSELEIAGKTFTGREIRDKLKLRSTDFSIEQKKDHLVFTTKGYGHGIGMSQYGANFMAKDGKNYKDIVKHYYKGVKISEITDTAPTLVAK